MRLVTQDPEYVVLDEVFDDTSFSNFCSYFNNLDFAFRSMSGWQKVWRINDGQILAGAPYYHSRAPFNSLMDSLHMTIYSLSKQLENIVGKEGEDWKELLLTPYIYPSGTKISWHDDSGYTGACIFYPHPEWGAHWGGELMIAKAPNPTELQMPPEIILTDCITRKYVDPLLNHYGMGIYINPKPNRLVFTKGKVWHSINRVDAAAGDNVRRSVVAFFMKEKLE